MIERLPGAKLTPEVLLHQTLEDRANVKAVMVVVVDNDDRMEVQWSQMPAAYLAMAAMTVEAKVRATIIDGENLA